MPSNVPTRLSPVTQHLSNTRVIKFNTPPIYRNFEVDISQNCITQLFEIKNLSGNNERGTRAEIPHTEQENGRCKVIIDNCDYEIIDTYTGSVSIGIEDI